MDIFCWNIRGINNSVKRRVFRKWIRKHNPIFGCLVETHVQKDKSVAISNNILPGWSLEGNYEFSELGKIWVLWKSTVQVRIVSKSLQMISCCVKLPHHSVELGISFVYGSNCKKERRLLWEELEAAACSPQFSGLPWIIMGDFNEIISSTEHSKADQFSSRRGMRDFSECLNRCSLADLPFCGNTFTWSNSHVSKKTGQNLNK